MKVAVPVVGVVADAAVAATAKARRDVAAGSAVMMLLFLRCVAVSVVLCGTRS